MIKNNQVSDLDKEFFSLIRKNISDFLNEYGKKYDNKDNVLLDIAPQDHEGARPYFPESKIETLDVSKDSGATYIADLCSNNKHIIKDDTFDVIVCTEVLEHTLQPFDAVDEIKRILKPNGTVLLSVPYNFRIHGPLPDCWRFTEHGLRALFKDFEIIDIQSLDDDNRFLAPIHYTLIATKKV